MDLSGFRPDSRARLQRTICVASLPFVLAFIAFNILDLDGSNLSSLTTFFERSIVDGDVCMLPRVDPAPEQLDPLAKIDLVSDRGARDCARRELGELHALSRLEKARTHLYHISLPRDSVPG